MPDKIGVRIREVSDKLSERGIGHEHKTGLAMTFGRSSSHVSLATVGLFYDDLGKLIAHRLIDHSYGTRIVRLWDARTPYVYAERQAHKLDFWVYFEDLAVRTAETPPRRVYDKLRMRVRPPRPEAREATGQRAKPSADRAVFS